MSLGEWATLCLTPFGVARSSRVKVLYAVRPQCVVPRAERCGCLVSSIRLRAIPVTLCGGRCRAPGHSPTTTSTRFHYRRLGRRQRGLRRATRERETRAALPPQFGFEASGDCRRSRTRDEDFGFGFWKIRTRNCLNGLQ